MSFLSHNSALFHAVSDTVEHFIDYARNDHKNSL